MSADTVAQEGARQGRLLHIWTPEDKQFWEREGEAVAKLNLWISVNGSEIKEEREAR